MWTQCSLLQCVYLAPSRETCMMSHSEISYKLYLTASMELYLHMVRQALAKHTLCKVPVGLLLFFKNYYQPQCSNASDRICVCVCPFPALSFESLDLETSFCLAGTLREYLGQIHILRSPGQVQGHSCK